MNTPTHKSSECKAEPKKICTEREINQHLAHKIWSLRDVQGLSQEKLAYLAGVSPDTVKRYESANSEHPSIYKVYAIARALNVSVDELLPPSDNTKSDTTADLRQHIQAMSEILDRMK